LATVARHLGEIGTEVVYLGGATTCLFLTDPASGVVRVTRDVDVVVEVVSTIDYQVRLRNALIARGFQEDTEEGAPVCRWVIAGVKVDIMPPDPSILGFTNRWYPDALKNFAVVELPSGETIKRVAPPYFLGTKLEAFHGRGNGDFQASADLEDIVTVVDGRAELVEEVRQAPADLREYLHSRLSSMLEDRRFLESLPGHLQPDLGSQGRLPLVRARLEAIAAGRSSKK
jgi:hypothetical protein